jgi:hypothetical protein
VRTLTNQSSQSRKHLQVVTLILVALSMGLIATHAQTVTHFDMRTARETSRVLVHSPQHSTLQSVSQITAQISPRRAEATLSSGGNVPCRVTLPA